MNDPITLLIYILVGIVIVWGAQVLLGMLAIPAQAKTLIVVIVVLVVLVWLLRAAGIFVL